MGIENMYGQYKPETVKVKRIGDRAYHIDIDYHDYKYNFFVSPKGYDNLRDAMRERNVEIQEELI